MIGPVERGRQPADQASTDRVPDRQPTTARAGEKSRRPVSRGGSVGRVRPADHRARRLATVAALLVVVGVAGGIWRTGRSVEPPAAVPVDGRVGGLSATPLQPGVPAWTSSVSSGWGTLRPSGGRDPIPSGGVAPITPPARSPAPAAALDPVAVASRLASAPAGDPTTADLGSPEAAGAAWLARWCPFSFQDPFGAAEQRARAAMTERGWAQFDPTASPAARRSWAQTVAAGETGRCAMPRAIVSGAAPRSQDGVVVQIAMERLVTGPDAVAYGERVEQTRLVLRGADGLWRVDLIADGG